MPPSYQLHRGDYLGRQHHLRVCELDNHRVAIQAHTEHWDWLLLTHVVDSLEGARVEIEQEFMGRPFVEEVYRAHYANGDTHDADGWATVIRLALLLPIAVSFRSTAERWNTPENRRRVALAASLPGVFLGVRGLGILAEQSLSVPVESLVPVLYPLVVVGMPGVAYLFGRRLDATEAFTIAAAAVAVAVRLDYSLLGISVLPVAIVVHRAVAVVALASLAAGARPASDTDRNVLVIGLGLWFAVMLTAFL